MGVRRNPQRGTWQLEVRYTLRGRSRRVRKDFSTKAEADKAHRKLKEDIKRLKSAEELGILPADEDAVAPASTTLTSWWASWIDVCEAEGNRPADRGKKEAALELHVLPVLGDVPLDSIRPQDLERIKLRLRKKKYRPATIRQVMAQVNACLQHAVRCEIIDKNPMVAVRKVKVPRAEQAWTFLDFNEADAFLAAAVEEGPLMYAVFVIAVRTGLRRGEIYGLKWDAIDLDARQLRVVLTRTEATRPTRIVEGPPKSGKDRTVGLTSTTVQALRKVPTRFRGGYVIADARGRPLHPRTVVTPFKHTLKRAGIERHVRFHDLRHTFASHLAMKGVPLAVIKELGGWSSYLMVQRYAHLSTESVVRHVDVLEDGSQRRGLGRP